MQHNSVTIERTIDDTERRVRAYYQSNELHDKEWDNQHGVYAWTIQNLHADNSSHYYIKPKYIGRLTEYHSL